jgi:hypothetical protein
MDAEYHFDLGEIGESIDTAEVVGIFLPLLRKTLLVDFRANETDAPYVAVVPMANSVEERFRSLKKIRPRFPRPDSMVLIPWPRYARSLEPLGVLDRIRARLEREGFAEQARLLPDCYADLRDAERTEIANAITGEQYQTIWQAN